MPIQTGKSRVEFPGEGTYFRGEKKKSRSPFSATERRVSGPVAATDPASGSGRNGISLDRPYVQVHY